MNILDPAGTRSQSPFQSIGQIARPKPLPSDPRTALAKTGAHINPTFTAATPPGQTASATQAAAATPPPVVFNPDEDPLVQLVKAAGQRNVEQAQAAELSGDKQTLIDYGYQPGLDSLYPDQQTADAAKQNPFSFLASLAHNNELSTNNLEESLNKSNLFYSGYRGQQLGELARNYEGQQAAGGTKLRQALEALHGATLRAQSDSEAARLNAVMQAYGRYTPPETTATGAGAAAAAAGTPAQTTEQLPIYTGQPLDDQILAELARVRRR